MLSHVHIVLRFIHLIIKAVPLKNAEIEQQQQPFVGLSISGTQNTRLKKPIKMARLRNL